MSRPLLGLILLNEKVGVPAAWAQSQELGQAHRFQGAVRNTETPTVLKEGKWTIVEAYPIRALNNTINCQKSARGSSKVKDEEVLQEESVSGDQSTCDLSSGFSSAINKPK